MMVRLFKAVAVIFSIGLVVGCAPRLAPPGSSSLTTAITSDAFITADGIRLPLRTWSAGGSADPDTVILAIHGFNDYSHFFEAAGTYFADHAIKSYAYDQRGFGDTAHRGFWAGVETYADDLIIAASLIRQAHSNAKLFILGESMGGAFAMSAAASRRLPIDGLILSAPAVWGRSTMPWYQQAALWVGAHTMPWLPLTGRGLKRVPSDNIEMLRALSRDPLVIKETRMDAIYGLVNAMDAALASASNLSDPVLYLYGTKDDIVPAKPTLRAAQSVMLSQPDQAIFAAYNTGHHMLLRDLSAQIVWDDIIAWMKQPDDALPSGADNAGKGLLQDRTERMKVGVSGSDS